MSRRVSRLFPSLLGLCVSCGDAEPEPKPIEMLDPESAHFGKTYAEWAGEWVRYVYSFAPPSCADPLTDDTGEYCAMGQDPSTPVFFLVGTLGSGPLTRTECTVPAGKALFFPLLNVWADSAGIPPEDVLSTEEHKIYVESFSQPIPSSFYVRVDGYAMKELSRGTMPEAVPYHLELPPEPNAYTCIGTPGVVGGFDGHVIGTWVMLPPLEPGEHVLEFGARAKGGGPSDPDFVTDTRYELTVQ